MLSAQRQDPEGLLNDMSDWSLRLDGDVPDWAPSPQAGRGHGESYNAAVDWDQKASGGS